MKSIAKAILFVLILLMCAPLASAQVINGSFEDDQLEGSYYLLPVNSNAIPGWTTTDSGVEWFQAADYGSVPAPDGRFVVDIANYTYSAGGLMQTIVTDPGTAYHINFSLGTQQTNGRDGTCEIIVEADGQSQTFSTENHSANTAWELMTFIFVADDTTADLSFRCLQNANHHFAFIDAVGTDGTVATSNKSWDGVKSLYR